MATNYKFGIPESGDREWCYGNTWANEKTSDGGGRLVIAPSQRQTDTLLTLIKDMVGPFWILYVLVVSRGTAEIGRYQSPEPQTEAAVGAFLRAFSGFLEKDGRHNLWIASALSPERLIYDRHNVIYAYGPLNVWRDTLAANGFTEATDVRFPSPHSHHYHQAFDADEKRLFHHWDWIQSPLKESDTN